MEPFEFKTGAPRELNYASRVTEISKRSKIHHFVPRVMQKSFCFRGDEIWYAEKSPAGSFHPPELTLRDKAFQIPNYYSVRDGDELSDIVEKEHYGTIDNYLGQLLPEVLGAFKSGLTPTFSGERLRGLCWVVYEMIKRTPEFPIDYDDVAMGREYLLEVVESLGKSSTDLVMRKKLLKDLEHTETLRSYGRDIRVRAVIQPGERVEDAMKDFVVRWSLSETRHSYILSSKIAYRIGNGGSNGVVNPNMQIWMPIDPKISLVLLRDPENKYPMRNVDTPDHIRQVNEYAVRNSEQIASNSQKLIESLTGKRSRFGELPFSERGNVK